MSVNKRYHRADLYVTPIAVFVLVIVFGALLIVGACFQ